MPDGERLDAVRAAHGLVAEWLLEAQGLITGEFHAPLAGVTAGTESAAWDELHVLGCLSLALDPMDDGADPPGADPADSGAVPDPAGPGVRPGPAALRDDRLARLLTDPIEVTFTSATGEAARVEWLPLDEIVAAARERRATIRRLVDAYRTAVRFVEADLDRLRKEVADLRHRAGVAGRGAALDVPAARLAGLEREAAADPVGCARPGPWRDALAGLADDLAAVRRALAPASDDPDRRTAGERRLRSSVRRLRELAAEAAREGLGDGGDPLAALDVDGLLARAAGARAASPGDPAGPAAELEAALDRAADLVDAARRRLRARCHLELGGRLEAYRQRAADEDRAEHPDLERSYREARDRLRPDRFAVTAASRAVRAYQQAVNEVTR
ncbi:hypothetical protein OOK41_25000 [Micromonospora sp. NBC_01655]|uniref:hypothetical protein n=1 Tax=Micromonospora sp. NBC_01655 TaxID=2975983 RepID=UPI00225916FF|nr:hypothetical protein [Micromonospora sp. NBC_01655]MCX4473523.1 hypothetical protein [Micromonospora sp. NBC_01655]